MSLGNVFHFWKLLKEVDPSDIAEAAERLPKIEIDADRDFADDLKNALAAGASRTDRVFQVAGDGVVGTADLIIDDDAERVVRRIGPRISVRIAPGSEAGKQKIDPDRTLVIVPSRNPVTLRAVLIPVILEKLPEHQIALGRHFVAFRHEAAAAIVRETSRGNAEFAALSNIPQLVPVIGNIIGSAADFVVLTKNQVLMLFKLATVFDRDSHSGFGILKEIVPVVGAGLVWRTVARQIAGLLPFFAGAVPKVIIAYAGTYIVGTSAIYYYEEGRKPPKDVIRQIRQQAVARAKDVRTLLPGQKNEPEQSRNADSGGSPPTAA